MKPITEQERKNIINFINAVKSSFAGVEPSDSNEFDLEELTPLVFDAALASLTADSVMQVIYNNPHEEGYVEWVDCNEEYFKGVPNNCKRIVYTAPPVPVVKMPGVIKNNKVNESDEYYLGIQSGWDECLEEIKRLNGIK